MLSPWDHSKENPIEFNYSLDGKFIARASSTMYFRLSWQLGVCFPDKSRPVPDNVLTIRRPLSAAHPLFDMIPFSEPGA